MYVPTAEGVKLIDWLDVVSEITGKVVVVGEPFGGVIVSWKPWNRQLFDIRAALAVAPLVGMAAVDPPAAP